MTITVTEQEDKWLITFPSMVPLEKFTEIMAWAECQPGMVLDLHAVNIVLRGFDSSVVYGLSMTAFTAEDADLVKAKWS